MTLKRYRKKPDTAVTAVQVNLDTDGFTYRKWGGEQRCKRGDWLIDNGGDIYTVDQETFARTYKAVGDGRYVKSVAVWAEKAGQDGSIRTKEGITHYLAGDYIVFNEPDSGDGYAVSAETFQRLYELASLED